MNKLPEVLCRKSVSLKDVDLRRLDAILGHDAVMDYITSTVQTNLTYELVSFAIAFTADRVLESQGKSLLSLEDDE